MRMYLETFAVVALWLVLIRHDQALLALLASEIRPNSAQEVLFFLGKRPLNGREKINYEN